MKLQLALGFGSSIQHCTSVKLGITGAGRKQPDEFHQLPGIFPDSPKVATNVVCESSPKKKRTSRDASAIRNLPRRCFILASFLRTSQSITLAYTCRDRVSYIMERTMG